MREVYLMDDAGKEADLIVEKYFFKAQLTHLVEGEALRKMIAKSLRKFYKRGLDPWKPVAAPMHRP